MLIIDLIYQYTGVLAVDIVGVAYSHARHARRTVRKIILHKKLYDHLAEYIAGELQKSGLGYKCDKLNVNGIPIEYSIHQNKPLVIEYATSKHKT